MPKWARIARKAPTSDPVLSLGNDQCHWSWSRLCGGFLALALNLASAVPAAALLCSTADPTVVPGGTVLNTIASDVINSTLGLTATPPFLTGSTSYTLTNSQPFITARTFVYNPSQPQSGAIGSFTLPLAQLRGLTREQYNDFFALPNLPNTPRNNAIALVVLPAGTQFWSGPTGPITDPSTGLFWGNGGGLQYFVGRQVTGSFQVPTSNYLLPTPDTGGPVLVYGPRLSGNARAIGSYLDQRCVAAYSDFDRVLTSLDVLNLANPTNAGPLAAAVGQLSPDRYGALPLIIGHQHTLILDAFGGRIDATRWPYGDPQVNQHAIAPGVMAWGRVLGDFGKRDDSSTMPGYRTNTGGGLGGVGYEDGDGLVLGIGGGYLTSSANWNDFGGSSGDIRTGVLGAYGGTTLGPMLIDGAVAGTYSLINVNRQIAIPDAGLGIPGLSTAITRTANGTTQAPGIAARLDFGTNLRADRTAMKPFVGLSYSWLDRRGFTEANAGSIDLTVNDKVSDGLRSRLGAVACYELIGAGPLAWALQGNFVWTHRLSASSGDITARLVGQPGNFTIETVQEDRDSLQPGLALIGHSASGHVFARYDGDFRQDFRAHTVTAGAGFKF
jgi:Autotransporter beta-domain